MAGMYAGLAEPICEVNPTLTPGPSPWKGEGSSFPSPRRGEGPGVRGLITKTFI
jgi:hypothetical protein